MKLTQNGDEILRESCDIQFPAVLAVRSAEPSTQVYGCARQAAAGLNLACDLQAVLHSGDHSSGLKALATRVDVNPQKLQGLSVGANVLKQCAEVFFVDAKLRCLATHLHR